MQQPVGEDVAALGVGGELDLVDGEEVDVGVARHRLDGAHPVARPLRLDLLLAGDQRHRVGADAARRSCRRPRAPAGAAAGRSAPSRGPACARWRGASCRCWSGPSTAVTLRMRFSRSRLIRTPLRVVSRRGIAERCDNIKGRWRKSRARWVSLSRSRDAPRTADYATGRPRNTGRRRSARVRRSMQQGDLRLARDTMSTRFETIVATRHGRDGDLIGHEMLAWGSAATSPRWRRWRPCILFSESTLWPAIGR